MHAKRALVAVSLGALALGCGGAASDATTVPIAPKRGTTKLKKPHDSWVVEGSRLLPDRGEGGGALELDEGGEAILVDRMRILERPDGSIARASELLPIGRVVALPLPSRLGGGYVFSAVGGAGTQLWRAKGWLGELSPLVSFTLIADEHRPVVAGFDRLYVRIKSGNKLVAIDAETGASLPLGPLPAAPSFGEMVFVDGWRAVIDADLRGPLATFDAGATWKPIDYDGRIHDMAAVDGRAVLHVEEGRLEVDARGAVTLRREAEPSEETAPSDASRPSGPLGKRPLRAALEDGWPDTPTTAVVARRGMLARVSLVDGRLLERKEDAYPEEMPSCHAIRLGHGFGFVCGEPEGGTGLYRFDPPLSMTLVKQFEEPRFVAPSGNGAAVIRGGCESTDDATEGARAYCILGVDGSTREIRVRGDLGAERVVALADGRVAVIVPPRPGATGQMSIIDGSSATHLPLALPDEPAASAAEVRRGLWLEGFEERRPGVLGGWIEAGGPILGIEVGLDGKVKAGEPRDSGGAVVSGRFGVFIGPEGQGHETTDGGMTYRELALPETTQDPLAGRSRACGPAGCVLSGWLRTGWGEPAAPDDLQDAPDPKQLYLRSLGAAQPLSLTCDVVSAPPARRSDGVDGVRSPVRTGGAGYAGQWLPFRGASPPTLDKDEIGVDAGAPYDLVPMRAYVWGQRGADWRRAGKLLIRFDDRFDLRDGQRRSALTASPWSDEESAAEAIGGPRHTANWTAFLDPGGEAALLSTCRGRGCSSFAVADRQPVLVIRDQAGSDSVPRPSPHSVIRAGETWFFLSPDESADRIALWRVDSGVARPVHTLLRPARPRFAVGAPPQLVRRAIGPGIGLFSAVALEPGTGSGTFHVFPIDPASGEVGEPIPLGPADLGAHQLEPCRGNEDGWLVEPPIGGPEPNVEVRAPLALDGIEARVRIDPGAICVEGLAARVDAPLEGITAANGSARAGSIDMAVTEAVSGARAHLACRQTR